MKSPMLFVSGRVVQANIVATRAFAQLSACALGSDFEGPPKPMSLHYDQSAENQPARRPVINVPTIALEGDADGAPRPEPASYRRKFSGRYTHRTIAGGIGHNLSQEAPRDFAEAVIDVAEA
jgi:pimeloyl-ACP methyl ester carboxylesterase